MCAWRDAQCSVHHQRRPWQRRAPMLARACARKHITAQQLQCWFPIPRSFCPPAHTHTHRATVCVCARACVTEEGSAEAVETPQHIRREGPVPTRLPPSTEILLLKKSMRRTPYFLCVRERVRERKRAHARSLTHSLSHSQDGVERHAHKQTNNNSSTNSNRGRLLPARGLLVVAAAGFCGVTTRHTHGGYLVDPASSHMLVSKIKPCMSKYKRDYTVRLRMAH